DGRAVCGALDMVEWADRLGCVSISVQEHHGVPDGYPPSPVPMVAAMAARTTSVRFLVAALIAPFYDPLRLAEDMVVLDIISGGRVSHVCAVGYRPEEYEHLGVDFRRRGKIADEILPVLLRAKAGEAFEYDGRRIHVTPPPVTPGGPRIAWGGGSVAAAKRAGRFGLDFFAQGGDPSLADVYADAARANGHQPGSCFIPSVDTATTVFVAHDVDKAWEEVGPHLLHDVVSYSSINEGNTHTASISTAKTVDDLRAENRTHRILTVDEAVAMIQSGNPLSMQPLVGGLAPEIAWRYLKVVTDDVMPRLG
ncbi:MAG: LLM class flavin-dependent oxidoreductase, partial [Actinobacteria bacterium]|nr:LLM class flavin-dependent oxidoreductase [Actinomycetota bacterium]